MSISFKNKIEWLGFFVGTVLIGLAAGYYLPPKGILFAICLFIVVAVYNWPQKADLAIMHAAKSVILLALVIITIAMLGSLYWL